MKKLKSLLIASAFLFCGSAFAAPISGPLPSDTYITANGLDWTWASPWSHVQSWVYGPETNAGWRYATSSELDYLFVNLINVFLNGANPSIQSTIYWNDPNRAGYVDDFDLSGGYIASGTTTMTYGNSLNVCGGDANCEQFYVRGASGQEPTTPVPAPATLFLFGLGLAALGKSKRKKV